MGKEGSFGAASSIPLPPLLFSNQQLTRASAEERRHAMAHMHSTTTMPSVGAGMHGSDCGRVLHPGRTPPGEPALAAVMCVFERVRWLVLVLVWTD